MDVDYEHNYTNWGPVSTTACFTFGRCWVELRAKYKPFKHSKNKKKRSNLEGKKGPKKQWQLEKYLNKADKNVDFRG
jgi:hypothetical protein